MSCLIVYSEEKYWLLPNIIIAKCGYTRFGIPECVYYGFPSGQSARGPLDSKWNYVRWKANPLSQASRNDALMCEYLHGRAIGKDMFNSINEIDWEKCTDISTDGAQAMVGKIKKVITRILQVSFKWWAFFRFLLELIYRKKDHQGNMGNYLESVARYMHTRTDGDNMEKHSKQRRIQIFQIAWGQ